MLVREPHHELTSEGSLERPTTSLASLGALGARATLLLTCAEFDQSLMMTWL